MVNDLPAGVGTKENPANPIQISALKNSFTDAEGNKSTTKVNLRGFVLEETDPIGRVTATERDSSQNPTRITWPNGEVETLTYDRNGNLLTHTSAGTGGTTTYTYDPVLNQVTGITDPKGHTTTMEYDTRGNLIKITDPQNHQTTMEYDARGLVTKITDALGHVTTNAYDSSGNLLSTTDPLGNTTAFTVDTSGKLVSATDPEGKTTSFRYDLANNPIETTAADGTKTSFTYGSGERCFACGAANGADLLTALSDANRRTRSFTYNEIGQLTQTINPAGLITAYQYDADRKLIGKTDPKGQTTAYLYDPAGQLIQKNLPDDQVQYFYDTMGNVSTVMDSISRVILAYDGQNRLIQSEIGFDTNLPVTIHQNTTVEAGNKLYDFRDITVDGAVLTLSGSHTFTNLNVINGATVTHKGATTTTTSSLALDVTYTLTIDATSRIDVSDKGYLGGYRGDNSSLYGRTVGNTTTGGSYADSGGSYSGLGGQYYDHAVNGVYGSLYHPDELGSGGGGNGIGYGGGNGGGLVRITAGEIVLNGRIQADGGDGALYFNGAGSGGGINIQTGVLRGTGSITANGGKGSGHSSTTGGGGGRIAVYYSDIAGFDPANISAYGGVGSGANGGVGTIYLKDVINNNETLILNNADHSGSPTPAVSGDGRGFVFNNLTLSGGAGLTTAEDILNVAALTLDSSAYSGISITAGTIILRNNSTLTHPGATTSDQYSLTVNVDTLTIDATSRIDVSDKGYLGGYRGDNSSFYGRTVGNTTTGGSYAYSGGSYGGLGGQYSNYAANGVYGSLYNPDELGSGGGGGGSIAYGGGSGGGLVRITAGEIVLDGRIQAGGGDGALYLNGGGSGGGINIQTGVLRGTGSITANGGKGSGSSDIGGGGGGRIAVYYDDLTGFDTANISAYGGVGSAANGGAGTIYLKNSAQPYGDLIVDNDGVAKAHIFWDKQSHVI